MVEKAEVEGHLNKADDEVVEIDSMLLLLMLARLISLLANSVTASMERISYSTLSA